MIEGADVMRGIESCKDRVNALGQDGAGAELGIDMSSVIEVLGKDAASWVQHLPVNATVGDVQRLVTAATTVAVQAGVRLGKFHSGEVPGDPSDPRTHALADCDRTLRASGEYDPFRCKPETWTCICGRKFVHVCDEAEGCEWVVAT